MEYCGKITRNTISRKRMLSTLGGTLAMVILTGMAYDLPDVNYGEMAISDTKMVEEVIRNPYQPINGSICGWEPEKILTQWPDSMVFQSGNMETGAVVPDILETVVPVLPKSTVPEITENSVPGIIDNIVPGRPENVVPSLPENAVPNIPGTGVPDLPEHVVPDIPETVLPDAPANGDIPDVPKEEALPDAPSQGTVQSTAGFVVNEAGMICRFIPEKAQIEDGYLILPSEGCTGIASGAFDGAGAGITDIEIPDNITDIEAGALRGLSELYGIWTGEGNPAYTQADGVLFDRDMTTIVAFPGGRIGTYELPPSVTRIADYAFAHTNLSKLVMIKSLPPEVGSLAFGESGGNGLTISAPADYFEEFQEIFSRFHVTVHFK